MYKKILVPVDLAEPSSPSLRSTAVVDWRALPAASCAWSTCCR